MNSYPGILSSLPRHAQQSLDQVMIETELPEGSLEIIKEVGGAEVRLTKLSSGAMAGEMAFYTGEVRSATIRASLPSNVYVLSATALQQLRTSHPALASKFDLYVIKKLANALMRANKLIASLK